MTIIFEKIKNSCFDIEDHVYSHGFRYVMLLALAVCFYMAFNNNENSNIFYILSAVAGVLFLLSFFIVWIIGLYSLIFYMLYMIIQKLNQSLFGDVLLLIIGIFIVGKILSFVFKLKELNQEE